MFERHLTTLREQHLLRQLRPLASATGPTVMLEGREVILLASNNYLGLATHPAVVEAALNATATYGVGSGAAPSRLIRNWKRHCPNSRAPRPH